MNEFECAVVQFESTIGPSSDGTVDRMIERIHQFPNADLIVFPELVVSGYHIFDQIENVAEPVPGPTSIEIGKAADYVDAHILFGMPVKDGSRFRNSAVWIDRAGDVLGRYDKCHLWGDEQICFTKGDDYVIADVDFGKVGIQICYDSMFPVMSAKFANVGVDLIANISAWSVPYEEDWFTILPARALENASFLLGSNLAGTENNTNFCGQSLAVDPNGLITHQADGDSTAFSFSADKRKITSTEERIPIREDWYDHDDSKDINII